MRWIDPLRPYFAGMVGTALLAALLVLVTLLPSAVAKAKSIEEIRAERPDLFHPQTGYRIARYRAPTPDAAPGVERVDVGGARLLLESGAIALDVAAAAHSRYDEFDGVWLVSTQRYSLPGAVWLPEVGRGNLSDEMRRYLEVNLTELTSGVPDRAILVFCIADCWMSWNAAQRIAALGYQRVYWFADGVDGWLDAGWDLEPVNPIPVNVD